MDNTVTSTKIKFKKKKKNNNNNYNKNIFKNVKELVIKFNSFKNPSERQIMK